MPREAQHLLVWHQGALGDVLLAGPALQAVAGQYPGARLTLVGGTEQLGLLTETLPVGAVWSGHQGLWLELFQETGEISARLKEVLSPFDLALVLTPAARPEFWRRLKDAGLPRVVWLPSFPVETRVPVRELQFERLAAAGLKNPLAPFHLRLPEAARQQARSRLMVQGREQVRVALGPGSGHPKKNWPRSSYLELAEVLEKRYEVQVWWVLGPAESGWPLAWQEDLPQERRLQNLPLRHLAACLAEFQLYVGNDSGVTHLAAAVGGPAVVAIFGPTDPVVWSPPGERTVIITPEQPCAPCTQGREIGCKEAACLITLTPEQVLQAIAGFIRVSGRNF